MTGSVQSPTFGKYVIKAPSFDPEGGGLNPPPSQEVEILAVAQALNEKGKGNLFTRFDPVQLTLPPRSRHTSQTVFHVDATPDGDRFIQEALIPQWPTIKVEQVDEFTKLDPVDTK